MPRDRYGEPEHPLNFSYPPVPPGENLPGNCPNPPWMYIKYYPNGEVVRYSTPSSPYGPVGLFHWLPASKGAVCCRSPCVEGSECEARLKDFFMGAAARVGWRGDNLDDLVWRVIEAVVGGELDRYGLPTGSAPGHEVGYSERYRR